MLQPGSSAVDKVEAQLAASRPRLEALLAAKPLSSVPGPAVTTNIANNILDFIKSAFDGSPVPLGRNYTLLGLGADGAVLALEAAWQGWPAAAAAASPLPGVPQRELGSVAGQAAAAEVLIVADLASSVPWEAALFDDGATVSAVAVTDPAQ